jgi:hypothetical protein
MATLIVHPTYLGTIYDAPPTHMAGVACPICERGEDGERYRTLADTHPVASVRAEARRLLRLRQP